MKKYILPIIILTVITLVTLGCANHSSDDYITFAGDAPGYGGDVPGSGSGKVIWEGSGTVEDPYLVPDADHLDDIRNKSMSACYKQTAHINLSKFASNGNFWQPIGWGTDYAPEYEVEAAFAGKYDGNGYRIVKLFVRDCFCSGLFGCLHGAEISNLVIENAIVMGNDKVGILAGQANGNSIIRNCRVLDSTVQGDKVCGGIVGLLKGSTVLNCCVDQSDVSGNSEIGCIVGECSDEWYDSVVDNCYVNHSMVNGSESVGAISGCVIGRSLVSNSFACGDMSVKWAKLSSETDGLVGTINRATVKSCYYWKDGYKQGTTTDWTDWDTSIWNIPSTVPCLPTLRMEQEPPSKEWYKKSGGLVPPKEPQMKDQ